MYGYIFTMTIGVIIGILLKTGLLVEGSLLLIFGCLFVCVYFKVSIERLMWSVAIGLCVAWLSLGLFHYKMGAIPMNQEVSFHAEVCSVSVEKDSLVLKVIRNSEAKGRKSSQKIILRSFSNYCQTDLFKEWPSVGDIYLIKGCVERIEASRNPGQSNFCYIYFGKGITGQLTGVECATFLDTAPCYALYPLMATLRQHISNRLAVAFAKKDLGIALGMSLGDKSQLSEEVSLALRNIGLSHILVVSSLHVGLLLVLVDKQLHYFNLSRWLKDGLIVLILSMLLLISVSKISILKCVFIYVVHLLALRHNRKPFYMLSLALYVLIALIINPYYIYNLSFTLSTMAYVGVFLFYRYTWRDIHTLARPWYLTLCIYMAISPIMMVSFGGIHYLGIFISPLIMPVIELIIGMNFINTFIQSLFTVTPFSWALSYLFRLLHMLVEISKRLGEFFLLMPYHSVALIACFYLLVALVCIRRKWIQKRLVLSLCVVMSFLFITSALLHHLPMRVFFLDVGMGDSALLYQGTTSILIDGGTPYQKSVLENAMKYVGEKVIDIAILSHEHQDHYGGLIALMEEDKIKTVYMTQVAFDTLKENNKVLCRFKDAERLILVNNVLRLDAYKKWSLKLYPPDLITDNKNDHSLICLLQRGEIEFLFTGDAEQAEEESLLMEILKDTVVPVDYLKVPHHGSDTSSSESFLLAATPNYGMISVARENKYGLPDQEVLDRYQKLRTTLHRTDESGALEVKIFYPWRQHKTY